MISLERFKILLENQSGIPASFSEKLYRTLSPAVDWTEEMVIAKCPDFESYWDSYL